MPSGLIILVLDLINHQTVQRFSCIVLTFLTYIHHIVLSSQSFDVLVGDQLGPTYSLQ